MKLAIKGLSEFIYRFFLRSKFIDNIKIEFEIEKNQSL